MKKAILKHVLFVVLLALTITVYVLYWVCVPGSMYYIIAFPGYFVLIFWLVNAFYIKKNSGTIFKLISGFTSLLCFIPFPFLFHLYGTDGLGIFLATSCTILFVVNLVYIIIHVSQEEKNISLILYPVLLAVTILMISLGDTYVYHLICSNPT